MCLDVANLVTKKGFLLELKKKIHPTHPLLYFSSSYFIINIKQNLVQFSPTPHYPFFPFTSVFLFFLKMSPQPSFAAQQVVSIFGCAGILLVLR